MTAQSTTAQWNIQGISKDSFSVFSLLNEKSSNKTFSPINEEVQGSFKSFSLNHSLSLTSATAPTKKAYSCKKCGQVFSRPHNLKSHLTTHSSLRPYKCGTCNHYFRRQHDLKRHQKLHTGEKPYSCGNCHRAFARLDALNRHTRSEGMNACATVHNRKSSASDKIASPHSIGGGASKRPNIPHINITNRASKPYPSCPPKTPPHILELSPVSGPSTPLIKIGSLPSAFMSSIKELSPTEHISSVVFTRSPTWSPPSLSPLYANRTLPLPNELNPSLSGQYEKLEIENKALKHEINMVFHDQLDELKARVYDLEIENRVLRSLISDQHSSVNNIKDIDSELK